MARRRAPPDPKTRAVDELTKVIAEIGKVPRTVPATEAEYNSYLAALMPLQKQAMRTYRDAASAGAVVPLVPVPDEDQPLIYWLAVALKAFEHFPHKVPHPNHIGTWDPMKGRYVSGLHSWPQWVDHADKLVKLLVEQVNDTATGIDRNAEAILRELAPGKRMTLVELAAALQMIDRESPRRIVKTEKTIGVYVRQLIDAGYARRPTERKGVEITDQGREFLKLANNGDVRKTTRKTTP